MTTPDNKDRSTDASRQALNTAPISLLETIRTRGRVWGDLAAQYGVSNPEPPWKVNLDATCDVLGAGSCALPVLERRWEEDELSADLYADVPFPERQLLALAHSMIRRGLVNEDELTRRMAQVDARLKLV